MPAKTTIRRKPPAITETHEHLCIAMYFRKVGLGGLAIAVHLRNERHGHTQRMLAARMGVAKGMPDWMIIDAGRVGFIELKPRGFKKRTTKTGNYTAHEQIQLDMHKRLKHAGAWVEVCESLDEVLETLHRHGVPLRSESISTSRIKAGFRAEQAA